MSCYGYVGLGYTCSACGHWVPNGVSHSCPTVTFPAPSSTVTVDYSLILSLAMHRLAAAIEGLTATLES